MKRSRKASELKRIWRDLDCLKELILNEVQSISIIRSSEALKDIEKNAKELKQGSTK